MATLVFFAFDALMFDDCDGPLRAHAQRLHTC
jgi:hypothetical protein